MGVNFRDFVPKTPISLDCLSGKRIAIDAYNAIYQFLAIIRQPDGTPLKDRTGRITSHLSGLLYRTSNLVEMGIRVIYVFDGVPPSLKEMEIKRRVKLKEEAVVKYEEALRVGKIEEARTYAQMTSRLQDYMRDDAKHLLELIGVPWVQAPSEGEAQASYMAKKHKADFCASQDYDSLLFGAPKLVRNLTISGRRRLPRKKVYVEVIPEMVELDKALKHLGITHEQLIDIGILVGTDFNPEGLKGIGPQKALNLIKQHGSLEKAIPKIKNVAFPVEPTEIREIFLHPEVTDNYNLTWKAPNAEGVIKFMCDERDFDEARVIKALEKINIGIDRQKSVTTIDKWFGRTITS